MQPRILAALVLLPVVALFSGGCLKRTISVTTEPPGALVWINDVEVGRTPLETDFTFYGDYDVRIRREGYEPIITHAIANTPIQEQPGIDLLAEAMPVRFHDVVKWHWDLVPVVEVAKPKEQGEQELIARARDLRTASLGASRLEPQPAQPETKPAQPVENKPAPVEAPQPVDDKANWIKGTPLPKPAPK